MPEMQKEGFLFAILEIRPPTKDFHPEPVITGIYAVRQSTNSMNYREIPGLGLLVVMATDFMTFKNSQCLFIHNSSSCIFFARLSFFK